MSQVHAGDARPICNQDGDHLDVRLVYEFFKANPEDQCHRCLRSLGRNIMSDPLSSQQERLLQLIFDKTAGVGTRWSPVTALYNSQDAVEQSSTYRSLRRLCRRGLIEKKRRTDYRTMVRLTVDGMVMQSWFRKIAPHLQVGLASHP